MRRMRESDEEGIRDTSRQEDANFSYNKHFHDLHREDGRKPSSFVNDDMFQVFYPKTSGGWLGLKEKFILSIFDAFTEVIPHDQKKYDAVMQQIITNPKNTFVDTNHATFANIPIGIRELHRYAKKLDHKEKIEKIFTILAPSLTTQTERYLVNILSNLLKTFTLNPKSKIVGLEHEIKMARSAFKAEIDVHAQKQGNIFMMASGGTRDILQRHSYGEIAKIYMEKNRNVWATSKFLESMIKEGDQLVLEGMNETEIKRPDKTNPKDHTWTKGNTYVDIEILSPEEATDAIKSNTVLERIAALTKDAYGRQVGQVVTTQEMEEIKHEMKTNPKFMESYPEQTFDDDIVKETMRGLYYVFKKFI